MGMLMVSPLYRSTVDGTKYSIYTGGLLKTSNDLEEVLVSQPAMIAVVLLLALLPIVAIFLFKNRKTQSRLVSSTMLSYTAMVFVLAASMNQIVASYQLPSEASNYSWGLILPFLGVIFLFLANRAIKKDDELIRSADRLR